jgi:hypothetical protein
LGRLARVAMVKREVGKFILADKPQPPRITS